MRFTGRLKDPVRQRSEVDGIFHRIGFGTNYPCSDLSWVEGGKDKNPSWPPRGRMMVAADALFQRIVTGQKLGKHRMIHCAVFDKPADAAGSESSMEPSAFLNPLFFVRRIIMSACHPMAHFAALSWFAATEGAACRLPPRKSLGKVHQALNPHKQVTIVNYIFLTWQSILRISKLFVVPKWADE